MGCFSEYAAEYGGHGLAVFPINLADKKPCLKGWQRAATSRPEAMARRFPDAGIGVANDSGLTVIDVDDPSDLDWSLETFGDTPIKIKTPGGFHLWYRANGEKRRIRPVKGRAVDLLGKGGYAIAPPSQRPDGAAWRFLSGGIGDLIRLPAIRPNALPDARENLKTPETSDGAGSRNVTLFRELRRIALECADSAELAFRARGLNEALFTLPLERAEVEKIASSVAKIVDEGRLIVPGSQTAAIPINDVVELSSYPGGGGQPQKQEEQPHAKVTHAPGEALRRKDEKREAVPVACDG